MIQKFRKRPVVIEAVRYDGTEHTIIEILELQGRNVNRVRVFEGDVLINTLEGRMRAGKGDWIIKGVNNELYPCKNDIFEKTYERVEP